MENKNKGFTLIELLAVLAVLGILISLVVSQASKTIKKANIKYYKNQEDLMVIAAKDYFLDYQSYLPKTVGESVEVTLNTLESQVYIDRMKDVNNRSCDKYESKVTVTKTGDKEYQYKAHLSCLEGGYETKDE